MRAKSLFFSLVPLLVPLAVLAACTKQDDKAVKDEPKKATPVTSADLGGFNDFLPPSGGAAGIAVRIDGGGEAGLPSDVPTGGNTANNTPPPAAGEDKLRVTDAGSDPKVARRYTFVANKVDKRIVTIAQESQRAGQRGGGLTLLLGLDFVPKKVEPKGSHFDFKLTKAELPGAAQGAPAAQQAQIQQALAGVVGLGGGFEITSRGIVGEIALSTDPKMQQNQLAEGVVQGISQIAELLTPSFPEAPIGVGAKWERNEEKVEGGAKQTTKAVYTLKEVNAEGGVIETDIEVKVPKRPIQAPRVPPGTTVSIDGKGHYTFQFRFDRLATKVVGELHLKQHIEATDEQGKRQSIDDIQIAKQTIEMPK